ncbi:MAG: ROK family protein [Alphaproteobacteria bacterium]|nr:MAG: ROK family protein [Alphaproteobacteria bacterium]
MLEARYRIGVDLGGTKTEAILLAPDGQELVRRRVPTPAQEYRAIVASVADLVRGIEHQAGVRASVGVAMPGAISPATGRIKNANTVVLNGQPLDQDLAAALQRPVRVQNDANCFAVSEATDGAAAGQRVVFGVILGTGVGGGIVVDGVPLAGANAIAGEWGHNPLPSPRDDERPGAACYCSRHGCIETFLSGPALARAGGRDAAALVAAAEAGEAAADMVLARYEDQLARALASVINLLDPDAIVLGGGLSKVMRFYCTVPVIWQRYVFSDRCDTPLLPPVHGDSSGVRGAAWLWPREGEAAAG